jgi:muramoyltetrapeptide carboxypeptidase
LHELRKPRALRPGDRIAIVAPASGFAEQDLHAGLAELRSLGFDPCFEASISERDTYTAGSAAHRAGALVRAWRDPEIAAIVAVRGGYGSAHLLPLLTPDDFRDPVKAFVAYSDNTALMAWLTLSCGIVTFHGPMVEGRLAAGPARYDRATFLGALTAGAPLGPLAPPTLQTIRTGEATGMLTGGTMTQLAASLGTPYAFDPPEGCVLFLDEVGERPYRVHRLFTQLQQAGVIARASALVFNELPRCCEPAGSPDGREVVVDLTRDFRGPVLFGFPSGHTDGATLTLPFGVHARVVAGDAPALHVLEAAVV